MHTVFNVVERNSFSISNNDNTAFILQGAANGTDVKRNSE